MSHRDSQDQFQTPFAPARTDATWQFFGATLLWSWLWWWPIASLPSGAELSDMPGWMMGCLLVGAYGPSLMGLWFSYKAEGRSGPRRLLRGLMPKRALWRWLLVATAIPWLMMLVGVALLPFTGLSLGSPTWSRLLLLPVAIAAAVPFGPLAEELGWRGYALPRLVNRYGAVVASFAVGFFWTLWHVPLFWAPAGTTISGGPVSVLTVSAYAATLIAMSFVATWLMWRVGNVVLLAVAVHVGFNVDVPLIPFKASSVAADRMVMVLAAVGAVAIIAIGCARLKGVRQLDR